MFEDNNDCDVLCVIIVPIIIAVNKIDKPNCDVVSIFFTLINYIIIEIVWCSG
jgi:hypothetical protein